ncbi:MAG: type II secretion system protein [Phycisphaerae bacterium]
MKKRAFTLIELLVVISIIAMLMAIMMPALSKAREQARRTICGTNARSTGLGLSVYSSTFNDKLIPLTYANGALLPKSDYAGFMPFNSQYAYSNAYMGTDGYPKPMHLAHLYSLKMIDDPKVFYCPSQPRPKEYPIPYNYGYYTNSESEIWGRYFPPETSIAVHYGLIRTSYNYWTHNKRRSQELNGRNVILVDNLEEWEVVPHRKGSDIHSTPQGITALFADGHVNFCTGSDIFADTAKVHDVNGIVKETVIWPKNFDTDFDGPGNNPAAFRGILEVLEDHQ